MDFFYIESAPASRQATNGDPVSKMPLILFLMFITLGVHQYFIFTMYKDGSLWASNSHSQKLIKLSLKNCFCIVLLNFTQSLKKQKLASTENFLIRQLNWPLVIYSSNINQRMTAHIFCHLEKFLFSNDHIYQGKRSWF